MASVRPSRRLPPLAAALALGLAVCAAYGQREALVALPAQPGPLAQVAARLRAALAGLRVTEARGADAVVRGAWEIAVGIGALGEETARRLAPDARLMSCAAPSSSASGVVLEHELDLQFATLRRVLPDARRVGLLFLAPASRPRAVAAAAAAQRAGLATELLAVTAGGEAAAAVDGAAADLDAVMLVADAELLAPQVARALLLVSMRQRLPLVGPAGSWARAGALYALDWDWDDLGEQCADTARRLLGREAGGAPQPPRRAVLVLNRRAAQHLKIRLPEAVLREAGEVYD